MSVVWCVEIEVEERSFPVRDSMGLRYLHDLWEVIVRARSAESSHASSEEF